MSAADGHDEEFGEFALARSPELQQIAQILCGDPALAEDLVQAALEDAYMRWNQIRLEAPLTYVRRSVVNLSQAWVQTADRSTTRSAPSGRAAKRRPPNRPPS